MIKVFYITLLFIFLGCTSESSKKVHINFEDLPKTKIEFNTYSHNFGKLQYGEVVSYSFKYTNTGEHALVIDNVESDCSCTKFKWNKTPLKPGASDYIDISYNSTGQSGNNFRTITLTTNTVKEKIDLHIGVLVIPEY